MIGRQLAARSRLESSLMTVVRAEVNRRAHSPIGGRTTVPVSFTEEGHNRRPSSPRVPGSRFERRSDKGAIVKANWIRPRRDAPMA